MLSNLGAVVKIAFADAALTCLIGFKLKLMSLVASSSCKGKLGK